MHQTHRPRHRFHAATIVAVRIGISVIVVMVLGLGLAPGCGGEPGVSRAEHEALLQRVDAMASRLEAFEGELAKRPTPEELWRDQPMRAAALEVLAAPPRSDGEPPSLPVRVTAGGVEIDGKAVADDDLLARFREIARAEPRTRLSLMSEPDASYQALVRTMDLAREAGLTDVAITARVHGEGEGAVTAGL
jgi:hypothetical protein